MICPSCGFENIQGVDECENCGADLRTVDIPAPGTGFEATMVNVPLAAVQPHAPLTISSEAGAADAVRQMQAANVGCLIVEDGGVVTGILSERDLVMKLESTRLAPQLLPSRIPRQRSPRTAGSTQSPAQAIH